MRKGKLYVITAPSGAGKGTILAEVLKEDKNLVLSVSATTRKPREGEIDGASYHFLTKEQFEEKINDGFLLEYAEYAGNYYGTPLDYINQKLDLGFDVILEIEVVGAKNVRNKCEDATLIFIAPPSFEELKRRLVNRGTEDMETIEKRLAIAKEEMKEQNFFDFVVVNDEIEKAKQQIIDIIKKGR